MKKSKLDKINTGKADTGITEGVVYDTIDRGEDTYRTQPTASKEEQEKRKAEGKTQGRKGCHAARINLAYTTENFEYIKTMARATGQTQTAFLNSIIEKDRAAHAAAYKKAKDLLADLEAGKEEN